MLLAYCKKHDLKYYIPTEANAYNHFRKNKDVPFYFESTGEKPIRPYVYREPNMAKGIPCYHEIPKLDNVSFDGYFQSFLYFDWCRDYILETFNLPYAMEEGMTAISVRRGDCIGVPAFPIAPREYYVNAVKYMQEKGYNKFRLYSDDIPYCKHEFVEGNFPNATFEFSEGKSELEDYISLSNCENQITARSTFSLTGAWMNQNPNKIVCVPTTRHKWWNTQNSDLLTDTGFIQVDFQNTE